MKYCIPSSRVTMVVILTLSLMLSFPAMKALAVTEGPNPAGLGENISTIGTEAWQNPGNITEPGLPYTTTNLYHAHRYSNYLRGTQYGFGIPTGAVITGIEITINRMSSGHSPSIVDNVVRLVKAGNPVGDNKASLIPWSTTLLAVTYGGQGDLWGTTWTTDDVNSGDFGVLVAAYRDNNGNKARIATVDSMQITIYYNSASSTTVDCGEGIPTTTYGESITCEVTVADLAGEITPSGTVDWSTDGNGTFDLNPCTLSGGGGTATCTAIYTPAEVGSGFHVITAAYDGDDYFSPSNASETVTVLPRHIIVTADPQSKIYGDPEPDFTYQITEGSLVPGDEFTGTLSREPGIDTGNYAILQGTLALSPDYELTYLSNDLTITPRPVIVTANPQSKIYGDSDPGLTYQITEGSLVYSDTFTGTLSREPGEDVGAHAILQGTVELSDNYELTYISDNLIITPRLITVTADLQSKVYGDPNPEFTYQITEGSLAFEDNFTGRPSPEAGDDVGTYAILQGDLALSSNYELTYLGNNLTITPRPVVVTADPQFKFVGQIDPVLTYQITEGSLVFEDTFTGGLTREPGDEVGTYAILQGSLSLSTNYELSFEGDYLTITNAYIWLPVVVK